jgi:inward rectifier potassium channel
VAAFIGIGGRLASESVAGMDRNHRPLCLGIRNLVIALSWPRFILLIATVHIAINVGFAMLYLARPGAIANAHPGSLADAFFFSVETSATVGYGEMYPATLYGHVVSTAEIFVGVAFTALATGLLFVRFSRPKARILYAANPVIARHAGHPTLMIRIANGRRGLLYDAAAHLSLLLSVRGENGELSRRVYELQLTRSRLPIFSLTWTLMHRIDEASPLKGYDTARLIEQDALLLLGVEARDITVSAGVIDTKGYRPTEILFEMRYADLVSFDSTGHPVADLSAVSRLEPDIGPEPPRTGWQDRSWSEP